jgi:hypothetical protein
MYIGRPVPVLSVPSALLVLLALSQSKIDNRQLYGVVADEGADAGDAEEDEVLFRIIVFEINAGVFFAHLLNDGLVDFLPLHR